MTPNPSVGRRRGSTPHVLGRYLLFQIPGWTLAVGVLYALVVYEQITRQVAVILFGLWMLKDFVLFPIVRIGYEPGSPNGTDTLIGAEAVAQDAMAPRGYVRLGAELWQAELADDQAQAPAGARVRVQSVRGLTLIVEPVNPGAERP